MPTKKRNIYDDAGTGTKRFKSCLTDYFSPIRKEHEEVTGDNQIENSVSGE